MENHNPLNTTPPHVEPGLSPSSTIVAPIQTEKERSPQSRFTRPTFNDLRGKRGIRIVALLMAFSLGLIGLSCGGHADVRSNNQKHYAQGHYPGYPDAHVQIHSFDITQTGYTLAAGCADVIVVTLIALTAMFYRIPYYRPKFEGWVFLFVVAWVLCCSIANTVVSRHGRATVIVNVDGGRQIPHDEAYSNILFQTRYWKHGYVRLYASVTWATLLFQCIATYVVFKISPYRELRQQQVKA